MNCVGVAENVGGESWQVYPFWGMDTEEGDDDNPLSLHKYLYADANPVDNVDHSGNDVGDTLDAMATLQPTILRQFQISINLSTTVNMRSASELHLSDAGARFTTSWDKFHPKPYNDSDGQCTWGYGHVIDSSPCTADQLQLSISQPAAVQQFKADATKFESAVSSVVIVHLSQNQFDALVDVSFNMGKGGLTATLGDLNKGNYRSWPSENFFTTYVYAHPKDSKGNKLPKVYLPGLLTRRWAEYDLFKIGIYRNHY